MIFYVLLLNFVYKVYHSRADPEISSGGDVERVAFGQWVGFGGLPPNNLFNSHWLQYRYLQFAINPAIGYGNRPSSCELRTEYLMYTVNAR